MKSKEAPQAQGFTITLDEELYNMIDCLAAKKGIEISTQVKFILADYLYTLDSERDISQE
jgi:hypothetical protein